METLKVPPMMRYLPHNVTRSLQEAFNNESQVRRIISEQTTAGVKFNKRRADRYISYITGRQSNLYRQIRPLLQLEVIQHGSVPVNKPFKKDGTYSLAAQGWYGNDVVHVAGAFTRVKFLEPDLGSRKKLQSQLLRLGWKPRNFTPKGSPKLTVGGQPCESLNEIGSQVGRDIAEWYTLNHRKSQITGWLNALRGDERLSQGCFTIGTPTYRFRHKIVVNVPKAVPDVIFGRQMRSLFTVPRGKALVGHDASGLELRMLAHYLNDDDYTRIVIEGDPHSYHQSLLNVDTRDKAKEFIYKYNYGAGDLLIGMSVYKIEELHGKYRDRSITMTLDTLTKRSKDGMVDVGKKTFVPLSRDLAIFALAGKDLKGLFLSNNPGLEALIERVQNAAKRGYLVGLDGRRVNMRRDFSGKIQIHKALNTLMQSAGSIVMKHSIVLLDKYIREAGLRSIKVLDMHDESQAECYPEEAVAHGELAVRSIRDAGLYLNLNCPLDAEYKIGRTWAETH